MNIDSRVTSLWKTFATVTLIIGLFSLLEYTGVLRLGNAYFGFSEAYNQLCGLIFSIIAIVLLFGHTRQVPRSVLIVASAISTLTAFANMLFVMVIQPSSDQRIQIMGIALFLIEAALLLGSIKVPMSSEADHLRSLIKNK